MPLHVDFVRPAPISRLSRQMRIATTRQLETRLAELLMSQLLPCDLGDGIEVLHDVESIEVEMECDLDDPVDPSAGDTEVMLKQWFDYEVATLDAAEEAGTHQFVRHSAPYERIEIQIDANAFRRATIEDVRAFSRRVTATSVGVSRPRHALARHRPAGSPETR
jgi:hypothetical protein